MLNVYLRVLACEQFSLNIMHLYLNQKVLLVFHPCLSQYWKLNAGQVLAVPELDFNSLQGSKSKRLR